MANPLALNDAELDAIRSLRGDGSDLAADDPIWDGLADLGLVELPETADDPGIPHAPIPTLTPAGRDYPTG